MTIVALATTASVGPSGFITLPGSSETERLGLHVQRPLEKGLGFTGGGLAPTPGMVCPTTKQNSLRTNCVPGAALNAGGGSGGRQAQTAGLFWAGILMGGCDGGDGGVTMETDKQALSWATSKEKKIAG